MSSWEQVGRAVPRAGVGTPRVGLAGRHRGVAALYGCAIFLSAFLLFGVEPIMGRLLLPWFGGSAAVWTVAVLFFQVALVLGYLYAHLLVRWVPPRRQMYVHIPVLLASLAVLPIIPAASWKPVGGQDPTLRILGLLALTVGPPFLVLSTCGPLLGAWYARGSSRPYRLFAISNGASLLGLLSYPLLIEPCWGHTSRPMRGPRRTRCSSSWRSRSPSAPASPRPGPSDPNGPSRRWSERLGGRITFAGWPSPRPRRCCSSLSPTT